LAARLRQLSGSTLDGSELVNHCFEAKSGATPVLRINGYQNKSEESEHQGFATLLHGIFGTFRNPPAHTLGPPRSGRSPSPMPWTSSRCCRALVPLSMLDFKSCTRPFSHIPECADGRVE
jgi:hypothetical protein